MLDAVENLGLMDNTRVLYTSDHGEAAGHHGIMGKGNHYEHALGIPLLISGDGVPTGAARQHITSHVDLFPTIVEAVGAQLQSEDDTLPGQSLWPVIRGEAADRADGEAFAEFHAMGARTASFALRKGRYKLIYHVDMSSQLFDLEADPLEEHDLLLDNEDHPVATELETTLRRHVNPEETDSQAKSDQRSHAEAFGGMKEVAKAGVFSASPIPGKAVELEGDSGSEKS